MKPRNTQHDETPEPPRRSEGVQLRARRSPRLIALGVLAVVLGALGAVALFTSTNDRVAVVAMATDIGRGETVEQGSLTTVEVPAALAAGALAPAEADALVGQRALSDLPQGSFPRPDHVGVAALPDDEALIGLRLPLGRLPITTMSPGTQVRLVSLADDAQADAVVVTVPTAISDGDTYVLDVRMRSTDADALAKLAATDQIALVMTREA